MTDHQRSAHELLGDYAQLTGLTELRFDSNGCARLVFANSVAVDLEVDDAANCIQVYSVLGPVPPGENEALYRRLLEANLFGRETQGSALSIDPVQNELLLCERVEVADASPAQMVEQLESFAGVALHWREAVKSRDLLAGEGMRDSAPQWEDGLLRG
jgi:hypothetical protein